MLKNIFIFITINFLSACGGSSNTPPPIEISFCETKSVTLASESPYVLPYLSGLSFRMLQGNCSQLGGHKDTFAYDSDTPMGTSIHAAREGVVTFENDQFSDDDHVEGHENNVFIEHDDATVIRYTNLMQGSVLVEVGERVFVGTQVGLSGNSGNSARPHLHLQAFQNSASFDKTNSIPLTFNNVDGIVDEDGLLIEGQTYMAL